MNMSCRIGMVGLALLLVGTLGGCEMMQTSEKGPGWCAVCKEYHTYEGAPVTHEQATAQPAPAKPVAAPRAGDGRNAIAIPTGVRETSVLLIERIAPTEVVLGQPFEYEIRVTNLTRNDVSGVVITDEIAPHFKFESSTPAPASTANNLLKWNLGALGPGEVQSIKVKGSATQAQALRHCLSGEYDMAACAEINVVQPALKLALTAPAEQLKCDPLSLKYVVTNSGTGVARNVVIRQTLPKGLTGPDGKDSIAINVGDLTAGQSREATVALSAAAAGAFKHAATATADGNLKADADAATTLREPVLTIACKAPERQFIGRTVTFEATITNTGDGVARDAVAELTLPSGTSLTAASAGGAAGQGKVTWNLGDLAPKAAKTVAVTVNTSGAGSLNFAAATRAYCAKPANCTSTTEVVGIPAILLEVVDESDPIEVGQNETYTIIVTNQGSAPDTNIKVTVTLEDAMQYVSSSGPTTGRAEGKTITFAPLPSLAPKASATWKVVVKATAPGDVRFKTTLNSDELQRPVEETEATNFYK